MQGMIITGEKLNILLGHHHHFGVAVPAYSTKPLAAKAAILCTPLY